MCFLTLISVESAPGQRGVGARSMDMGARLKGTSRQRSLAVRHPGAAGASVWRAALLGTVAGGALLMGYGRRAYAQVVPPNAPCDTVSGTTVTCTGDVSAGVSAAAPYTVLNVNTLTADITPGAGVAGIAFSSAGDVTINSNTGAFSIQAGRDGISASSYSGAVTVHSTGDISSSTRDGYGIVARAYGAISVTSVGGTNGINAYQTGITARSNSGAVTVDSTGAITSKAYHGIYAYSANGGALSITNNGAIQAPNRGVFAYGTGAVTVHSTGDITSSFSDGIYARATEFGAVSVTNDGVIHARGTGVRAQSASGAVTVDTAGNITSGSSGIFASNSGAGATSVKNDGDIEAVFGIAARSLGGNVSVTHDGDIQATSHGIYTFSLYGGITVDSTGDITSSASQGIFAKVNGAGVVSVTSDGAILAKGTGIYARSGGGAVTVDTKGSIRSTGGDGINALSLGSDVTVTNRAAITSDGSFGILASSGTGDVLVTNSAAVQAKFSGISAYSVSGLVTVNTTGDVTATASHGITAGSSYGDVAVINGGAIQSRNNGINARSGYGTVSVHSTGDITASESAGIYALSKYSQVSVTNGGDISAGNRGIFARSYYGTVTVDSTGDITTSKSPGIYAVTKGGAVSVISNGNVLSNAYGIHAFSSGSSGGAVTVVSTGDITAGASGLFLSGSNTSSNLAATAGGGTVTGGGGSAAVTFLDGVDNTLAITSTGTLQSVSGQAIATGSGNDAVTNSGRVIGNVELGPGANSFLNAAGGQFDMGPSAGIGAGNTLTNSGTLSPGGAGVVATTTLTGNLVQTASGRIDIDVDPAASTADRINVTGTANLAGTVGVNVLNPVSTHQEFTIISAAGGTVKNGLALAGGLPTTFTLTYPNANDVVLGVDIDFALGGIGTSGLDPNQTALALNLNGLINAGTGGAAPVTNALLGIDGLDDYEDALTQLLPVSYLNAAMSGALGAVDFSDALLSCRVREGGFAVIAEGQCVWAEVGGVHAERDATGTNAGAEEDSWRVTGGAQIAVSPAVRLGFAARYEQVNQDVHTNVNTQGDRAHAGVSVKYSAGPLLLAAAASAGRGWMDTDRRLDFGGFTGLASSDYEVDHVNGRLRAAYLLPMDGWYLKPLVDLNATHIDFGGLTEQGGGGAALIVDSADETVLSVSPALEIGAEWRLEGGTIVRPFLRAGATFYGDTGFTVTSRFRDVPAGLAGFTTTSEMDDVVGDVSAGLDLLGPGGVDIRLNYEGSFGETTESHAIGGRAAVKF